MRVTRLLGFSVAKSFARNGEVVSPGRLEVEICLIAPRGIGDMKKCLAYGLESVIIFDAKKKPAACRLSGKSLGTGHHRGSSRIPGSLRVVAR
jgi:hypothetical protein